MVWIDYWTDQLSRLPYWAVRWNPWLLDGIQNTFNFPFRVVISHDKEWLTCKCGINQRFMRRGHFGLAALDRSRVIQYCWQCPSETTNKLTHPTWICMKFERLHWLATLCWETWAINSFVHEGRGWGTVLELVEGQCWSRIPSASKDCQGCVSVEHKVPTLFLGADLQPVGNWVVSSKHKVVTFRIPSSPPLKID